MYAVANTTVSILRGTVPDSYGDTDEEPEGVIASGIIALILQESPTIEGPASETPRVLRTYDCTLPSGTDVTVDDRLFDEKRQILYEIWQVTDPGTLGVVPDLSVTLKRVTHKEHA